MAFNLFEEAQSLDNDMEDLSLFDTEFIAEEVPVEVTNTEANMEPVTKINPISPPIPAKKESVKEEVKSKDELELDNIIATANELVPEVVEEEVVEEVIEEDVRPETKEKEYWEPPADLVKDMPELKPRKVVFNKSDMKTNDSVLINNADAENMKELANAADELQRQFINIEAAKKRHGVKNLNVQNDEFSAYMRLCGSDPDYYSAQEGLEGCMHVILTQHPEWIVDFYPGWDINGPIEGYDPHKVDQPPADNNIIKEDIHPHHTKTTVNNVPVKVDEEKVEVLIDKTNVDQIAWTEEEIEKIRHARTVDVIIKEGASLTFNDVEDIGDNDLEVVMSQYMQTTNDINTVLPASRYRCTFRGLSYPEIIDLTYSNAINSLDSEKLKWTLAFNHISNMSIGPWESYRYYIANSGEEIKLKEDEECPKDKVELICSPYEDFLKKTSYMDISYILWQILCATSLDRELITMNCPYTYPDGHKCGTSFEATYAPTELLDQESVNEIVSHEMEVTRISSTKDDIYKNFMEGPVMSKSVAELPHSHIRIHIGHISAYKWLNQVYGDVTKFGEEGNQDDPQFIVKATNYSMLGVIKGVFIPKPTGDGYYRISKSADIVDVIHRLDEVDYFTLYKLYEMMTKPYNMEFRIKGLQCPHCHTKTNVTIDDMQNLLFIVAQSLESVQVELQRK